MDVDIVDGNGAIGASGFNIDNCYVAGNFSGSYTYGTGALVQYMVHESNMTNCYADVNISPDKARYIGGLVGYNAGVATIKNCFTNVNIDAEAVNNVSDSAFGGLVGKGADSGSGCLVVENCYATGNINGTSKYAGGLVGYYRGEYNNSHCIINDCFVTADVSSTGSVAKIVNGGNVDITNSYTLDDIDDDVGVDESGGPPLFALQVGVNGDSSSRIEFTIDFPSDSLGSLLTTGIQNSGAIALIDSYLSNLNSASTSLGAVQNRLMSSLESISVSYENLVSSRSTIRDADIAEVSSEYIKNQILQQAAATLLATANQAPAIALQLI